MISKCCCESFVVVGGVPSHFVLNPEHLLKNPGQHPPLLALALSESFLASKLKISLQNKRISSIVVLMLFVATQVTPHGTSDASHPLPFPGNFVKCTLNSV